MSITRSASLRPDTEAADPVSKTINAILGNENFITQLANKIAIHVTQVLSEKVEVLENKVTGLETQIVALTQQNDDLEQYGRRRNLRFFGIDEIPHENTGDVVKQILMDKLGIKVPDYSIDIAHRLPGRNNTARPILVRFNQMSIRNAVYNNKKKMKNTRIVIKEDLTKHRVALLKTVQDKVGNKNVWTSLGIIKVKYDNKILNISSKLDLLQLNIL